MPADSSITPLDLFGQDVQIEVQHDLLVMCCHWHWHQWHTTLLVSSMAELNLLGQDN